jgi:hypothetical protein
MQQREDDELSVRYPSKTKFLFTTSSTTLVKSDKSSNLILMLATTSMTRIREIMRLPRQSVRPYGIKNSSFLITVATYDVMRSTPASINCFRIGTTVARLIKRY